MYTTARQALAVLIVVAVFSTIAGCASTHGIAPHAQAIDPASLDTGAAIQAADHDAAWPSGQWWQAYGDPQLDQWVDAALAGNPSMAAATARVRAAQALAGVAAAGTLPELDANASIDRQHWANNYYYGPGELAGANTWDNTATLGFSYHLDLWGGDHGAAERALDTAHASAADARAAQLELEANVVHAYIALSLHYALRDIARATLDQQQQIVTLARRRFAGGLGTQLELSSAEQPLPETQRQLEALDESIELSRNELAALAGKGPGAGAAIQRPALSLFASVALPARLPAELVGHRPDVVAGRWRVAAQAQGITVAKAAFYPNINLLATAGGMAAGGGPLTFLHITDMSYTAGPALSLPIFEGGRLRGQLGAATAGYDLAVDQYNQTIVTALKSIADQIITLRSLARQQDDADRSVAAAQKSYDIALLGFKRGLTGYLEVLTAQSRLLRQQQDTAQVHAARLAAHAALVTALGGGLATPADGPSASSEASAEAPGALAELK